jgi:hypothetical protein
MLKDVTIVADAGADDATKGDDKGADQGNKDAAEDNGTKKDEPKADTQSA